MLISNLTTGSHEYTSNAYHVTGSYYSLSDLNTLIDAGRDPAIIDTLKHIRTGIGKKPVEQVFITHSHFDHAEMCRQVILSWGVPVYAHPASRLTGVIPVGDRQYCHIGDRDCEIIHTPGHSDDSICILCRDEGILFSGDSPVRIYTPDGEYPGAYLEAFEYICSQPVRVIYPGHGDPITENTASILEQSLNNLRKSRIF